jgi:hypothetical protein
LQAMEKGQIPTGFRLEKPKDRDNGRSRRRWEDTIKIDLKERMWEVVDCINLTQDYELVFNKVADESHRRRGE